MAKYWSATTTSFWDSSVVAVAQMPSDKVAITDAEYADLMNKQASGYQIVHNTSTGKPQAVAQSLTYATRTVQALDSEVVHTTGDEEIAGEKTFTTTPIVENAAPSVRCINTGLTKGTNPSALNISNSGWFDKNSKWLGFYGYQVETDGAARSYLGVYEFDSNSDSAENRANIGVEYPKNGTPFGFAPTTPTNAQTNEIVTANWVLNSATAAKAAGIVGVLPIENGGTGSGTQNFVDLSSSQTVGGGKTWTANQNVKKSVPVISFQNTGITKGTAPSSTQTTSITFGSNGGTNAANTLAVLQNYVETDGDNVVKLAAYDPTASATTNSGLVITYPKGGTPTFTLGGKNVVRSVQGWNADANGNVTVNTAWLSSLSMPSINCEGINLGASGTTYTAPKNGYFSVTFNSTSSNAYLALINVTNNMRAQFTMSNNGHTMAMYMPAKQGDRVQIHYSNAGVTDSRFVYANGEG